MTIYKILNNNVIIVKDNEGTEQVVMGKGIGFKKSAGERLDMANVDKVFRLDDDGLRHHFNSLSVEIPYPMLKITEEFIDDAQKRLKQKLNDSLHVSLVDHIFHALKRHSNGQEITNSLIWEINRLYPEEFGLAKELLDLVEQETGVRLPDDEAGFIAMHLINAEMNEEMSTTITITKEVSAILKIVQYQLGIEYAEESLNFYRFLTHLKFFVQRVANNMLLDSEDHDLYLLMKKKYPLAYECAKKIAEYIYTNFHLDLTSEEMLYLIIHLKRLYSREKTLSKKD